MSFTQDELRAFNSILEQRLAAHRRDVEHMLDLRIQTLRRDVEQRLVSMQQEVIRLLTQKFADQQGVLNDMLNQKFSVQQVDITRAMGREFERRQEQQQQDLTEPVNQSLAARLLAIEQLLQQQLARQSTDEAMLSMEQVPPFEAIEVQTDLPWDDLLAIFGKALDERLVTLRESLQVMMQKTIQETVQGALKDGTQQLAAHLPMPTSQAQEYVPLQLHSSNDNLTTMQEVFTSIEQLERIIESMQVAMTNNQALLANRLFHHQQLPHERAHPAQQSQTSQPPAAHASQPNGSASHTVSVEQDRQ